MLPGYEKAQEKGYARSYSCDKRTASSFVKAKKKHARKNKSDLSADYPGQKIQPDVKFVPSYCVTDVTKYYQDTAKDECTLDVPGNICRAQHLQRRMLS